MLSSMTQSGQPAVPTPSMVAETPRPASQAGALPAAPDALATPQAGFVDVLESTDELLAEPALEPTPGTEAMPADPLLSSNDTPQPAAEVDAETWLLSMLGQRDTQVQARDGESAEVFDDRASAQGAMALPGWRSPRDLSTNAAADQVPLADPAARLMDVPSASAAPQVQPTVLPAVPDAAAAETLDASLASTLERAVGHASSSAAAASPATTNTQALTQSAAPERTLTLQGPEHKWGEQMLHALRENVEMQVQQRMQSATIRLDPPELGSMEIFLSHESGRLSVQISAAQVDVARLLQSTSERLRQELVGQNFLQVSVGVSSDAQSGQQHKRQGHSGVFEEAPVMAASIVDGPAEQAASNRRRDVLITV